MISILKKNLLLVIIATFCISAIFTNCKNNKKPAPSAIDSIATVPAKEIGIKGSFSTQTKISFDSVLIPAFIDSFPRFKKFEADIYSFYRKRNYAYAWYDDNGMIEPATNLYNRIQNISEEGLPDSVPYNAPFNEMIESQEGSDKISPTLELMLTAQYLAYAKTVWEGFSEKQVLSLDWFLPRKKISSQQLLDSLIGGNNVLQHSPLFRQYNLLKEYLKKYKAIQAAGELMQIKADKKTYVLNDSSAVIAAIRERLFVLGDLTINNQSAIFDSTLQDGVKSFEHRFGYKKDGIVNAALIAEMNYPIEKRIEKVIVNMERSRWIPVQLSNNYLVVNIPEYKLHVYENDSVLFSMNVVVGKDQHKTVIFNGDMKYVVFAPYWNIPASILKNETLPAIKKNPNYLATHNMEWNGGNVRQKPGPNNSLGLVKFLFPNTHSIYLHDSPAKSLFKEDRRAFSHGCIRLAEPKKLAEYLLRDDPKWNAQTITAAMNSKKEQYVTLKNTVPVFISYFTAWVDRQGKMNFRKDVYNRDGRLAKMILDNPGL